MRCWACAVWDVSINLKTSEPQIWGRDNITVYAQVFPLLGEGGPAYAGRPDSEIRFRSCIRGETQTECCTF